MGHGGRLLVETLIGLGARQSFGVPGESYLPVLDALHDAGGRLDFTICRNEGGASFMAEAWGKLTGTPGICFVTRGPGATNASIGVHTARQNSTPMLLFVGQIGTEMRGREAFQEVDYRQMFGGIAKWVVEIDQVERIPEILMRAWAQALSGRPGPVVVALPEEVLTAEIDAPGLGPVHVPQAAPCQADIVALSDRLAAAERPLVIAGGGGWDAEARSDLARFLATQDMPALAAFRFHDLIDNHAPGYAGEAGVGMAAHVRDLIAGADLILALNIRFGEMSMDAYTLAPPPDAGALLVHVHASAEELNKVYRADLPILATPGPMAAALADLPKVADAGAWRAQARAGYEASFDLPEQPGDLDMRAVMAHLQEVLPGDAVLTNGAGNFAIWSNKHFRFGAGQRLLAPQSGAMGYGLPAAIAAKIADPARTVVCLAGDGDFQMNATELGTALQAGVAPVVLIVDNGTYGTIRMHQERHYPGRVAGTDIENPDFASLAEAYGMMGARVVRTADFAPAFAAALTAPKGAILDLMVGPEALTPRATLKAIRAAGEALTKE